MSSVVSPVGPFGCSVCAIGADEWLLARQWGRRTARAVGAQDPEWAEDVVVRVLGMVRASWPCSHATAPTGEDRAPVVTPTVWARLNAALGRFLSGVDGDRVVLDVLKDAAGDEPRRVAAAAPFTSRPERVLAQWLPDAQERAVVVSLIGAVQSFRHATGARWVLDGCPAADAAEYVLVAAGSRRRVGGTTPVLAGADASEVAAMAVSGRHVVRRAFPDDWARLQEMARAVLATAPVGPDGVDRLDVEDRRESEMDGQDLLLRALTDDEALAAGGDFGDFVDVLDRHCLLPRDEPLRTDRLSALCPLWASYRRSRQGRR